MFSALSLGLRPWTLLVSLFGGGDDVCGDVSGSDDDGCDLVMVPILDCLGQFL